MQDAYPLAKRGLPRDGIQALALSDAALERRDRELPSQNFYAYQDVTGSSVDVALYLDGEPECMTQWTIDDTVKVDRVVTLVISTAVHCGISSDAIKRHGQALIAMLEAIDASGVQTEVWADMMINGSASKTGRVAVRLKTPGDAFDPGLFMYAMTHASFLRALGLAASHALPKAWHKPLSVGGSYGSPVNTPKHMDEFPEGAVYIPSIGSNAEAGKCVDGTLRKLGLLT